MKGLDKQISIYSVDTNAFLFENEKKQIEEKNKLKDIETDYSLSVEDIRKELKGLIHNISDYRKVLKYIKKDSDIDLKNLYNKRHTKMVFEDYSNDELDNIQNVALDYNNSRANLKKALTTIKEEKNNLDEMFKNSLDKKKNDIRQLSAEQINIKNRISIFDSALTRILCLKDLSDDIIIVRVYHFGVLKDLIYNGFICNGERYRFFTASAGQIRTKKTVFIKESVWNRYEKTLMCGLTIDYINKKGGCNVNKFLAYLSLLNSATDLWKDFDIDRCIVVDDFETNVTGLVDFISDKTYEITRETKEVPITHTDGIGMMLPSVSNKNFMVRLPWVKGLLAVFPFDEFIKQANKEDDSKNHALVKDIYGKSHDIFKEDIRIILFKSQFKMWNFYKDWNDFKTKFIGNKCQAGICNIEEDRIPNAKINYQMVQTLSEMSDKELTALTRKSRKRINNLSTTVKSMLDAFGVTKYNVNKTFLQQALEIYPELLNDIYTKDVLRQIKRSLVKDCKAAKLDIISKYTFLVPDLYAVCEHLFLGIDNPDGLLKNGEVSCRLYSKVNKLDCLRSPHLYREHAIKNNVVNGTTSNWFVTDAIYTSCHDLISKVLQFDNDGDKSLVVADRTLVGIAERHMKDIIPLYYEMKKAAPVILNSDSIYKGLKDAYTGGNIGIISDNITKIWNSGEITEDKLEAIKLLCMENNFTIDYAKTLYKPKRPDDKDKLIKQFTKGKIPYFFIYAKDKTENKVAETNNSVVNKLDGIIKDKRMTFKLSEFGKLDYTLLMNNPDIEIDDNVINKYRILNRKYHYKINMEDSNKSNLKDIADEIRNSLLSFGYTDTAISDMLVKYLYGMIKSLSKEALWFCYGNIIVNNLKKNIGNKTSVCKKCGRRFEKESNAQQYCSNCKNDKSIKMKKVKCIDCKRYFEVDARNMTKVRCDKCQKEYRKAYDRKRKSDNK